MTGIHVNVAVGYGGRREIVDAVKALLIEGQSKGLDAAQIAADLDPDQLAKYLYTSGQPDPELVIRTWANSGFRFPHLAERLLGVLLLRGTLARFKARGLPAGPARFSRPPAALRFLIRLRRSRHRLSGSSDHPRPALPMPGVKSGAEPFSILAPKTLAGNGKLEKCPMTGRLMGVGRSTAL